MVTRVGNRVGPVEFSDPFNPDPDTTTGLTWGYKGGVALDEGVVTTIPDGTLTLADNSQNIVYLSYAGTPTVSSATVNSKPPQGTSVFLQIVTTVNGSIDNVLDLRNWTASRTIN